MDFREKYEKTWFLLAHVLGAIGGVGVVYVVIYEHAILLNLFESQFIAWSGAIATELALWFFAKLAMKDAIFRKQKNQLKKIHAHMALFMLQKRTLEERQAEHERFIEQEGFILARVEAIPDNGLPSFAIAGMCVIFFLTSIYIITHNRGESKKKGVDNEIKIAEKAIDSIAIAEIQLEETSVDANIRRVVIAGSINNEKITEASNEIKEVENQLSEVPNIAVNKRKELSNKIAVLKKDFKTLPVSKESEAKRAELESQFADWKKEKDSKTKQLKVQKKDEIRATASSDNKQVNFYAIITNAFYAIFQYMIVLVRTITGKKSFDLVEYILDTLNGIFKFFKNRLIRRFTEPKMVINNVQEVETVVQNENEQVEITEIPIEYAEIVKNTEGVSKVFNLPNLDLERAKAQTERVAALKKQKVAPPPVRTQGPVTVETPKPSPFAYLNPQTEWEDFKLKDLKKLMDAEGAILGIGSPDVVFNAIRMGRRKIRAGVPQSDSAQKMQNILDALKPYGVIVDPDDKMDSDTPQLKKKVIQSFNQKTKAA